MRWWVLLVATMSVGCAFEVDPCQSDDDCPPQTQCVRPPSTGVPVCIAPDEVVVISDEDASTPADMSSPDVSAVNNQANNVVEPPFPDDCPGAVSCGELEPNDTEDDAIYLTDFAEGCSGFGVENWSALHQDSLCPGDVDQFIVEYVRCEEGSFRITASLTTPQMCSGGDLEIAEGLFRCGDPNVRCEVDNGVQQVTIIVGEQGFPQPTEKLRFKVSEGLATSGLDYILRVTVGR